MDVPAVFWCTMDVQPHINRCSRKGIAKKWGTTYLFRDVTNGGPTWPPSLHFQNIYLAIKSISFPPHARTFWIHVNTRDSHHYKKKLKHRCALNPPSFCSFCLQDYRKSVIKHWLHWLHFLAQPISVTKTPIFSPWPRLACDLRRCRQCAFHGHSYPWRTPWAPREALSGSCVKTPWRSLSIYCWLNGSTKKSVENIYDERNGNESKWGSS